MAPPVVKKIPSEEKRRRKILPAARALFREKGFDNVSISEIARRAGTATGTVYLFAEDKTDLMHKVLEEFVDELVDGIRQELDFIEGPIARVRFVIKRHLATLVAEPELCIAFVREIHVGGRNRSNQVLMLKQRYSGALTSVLEEGRKAGAIRSDISLNMVRSLVFGGLEQLALKTWVGNEPIDQKAGVEELMTVLAIPPAPAATTLDADRLLERLETAVDKLERSTPQS